MEKHPIETIMSTTMENIRDMIDVNTVVGDAVTPAEGTVIIPISRVSFGFVAGGGEYGLKAPQASAGDLPFAGGTGAGVTVQPMGFLVVRNDCVRLAPAQYAAPVERVIEMIPPLLSDVRRWIDKSADAPGKP